MRNNYRATGLNIERLGEELTRMDEELEAVKTARAEEESEMLAAVGMVQDAQQKLAEMTERAAKAEGALNGERTARLAAEASLASERLARSTAEQTFAAALAARSESVIAQTPAKDFPELDCIPTRGKTGKVTSMRIRAVSK